MIKLFYWVFVVVVVVLGFFEGGEEGSVA